MDEYIKSDLFRYTGKVSFTTALKQFLVNRAFRVQVFIRASNRGGGYTAKLRSFLIT